MARVESPETAAQDINGSHERELRRLEEIFADLPTTPGQEKILKLKYKEEDLAVFDGYVREFLTGHVEDQGNLLAYLKRDENSLSFGLRDNEGKTNFSLGISPNVLVYHPIGFWGSWTKARREWYWKYERTLGKVSRFIQINYPRPFSAEEVELMETTAQFIAQHRI